ncbi:MAG: bifunctional class I SAM-dependent methyltransferase/glycosyltransferase family 2 protein [Candidatus Magasanikbacteria bacterium]
MNKIEIREYFNQHADKRDKWGKKNSYYHKEMKNLLGFLAPENSSVLDIGCSTGDVLANLKPSRGIGVDISPKVIAIAQEKYPHLIFKELDAESFNLDEKFDYIILSDVIGFFSDVQQAFTQVQKHSHNRTKVVITYYSYFWEPLMNIAERLSLKMKNPIQNWLAKSDVDNLLYLADFEVIKKGELLLFPKKIPLLSSFLNHFLAKFPLFRRLCLVNFVVARPKLTAHPLKLNPSVSVIIPARNERGNIEAAVKRLPKVGSHTEIIFVEGHSNDNTLQEMQRVKNVYLDCDIKVMVQDGKGKGDAVRKGFNAATGDILMILDADLTVRPEELPKFYNAIASGAGEFINGSRLVYPLEDESMRLLNIFGNKFFSMMFSWLLDQRLKDTLCGTKVIWKTDYKKLEAGRAFFGDFDPFGDFDLLFGAAKLNLKIIDLPIRYQARTYGTTNISRFSHGWLLLKMCFFAMKKIKFK